MVNLLSRKKFVFDLQRQCKIFFFDSCAVLATALAQQTKFTSQGSQGVVRRCSAKKRVLKNFGKFTGQDLCWGLFFKKVSGLTPATLLKRILQYGCYPVNFAKFL